MSIKIALAGNPNCGKTTLFNALTGANQFVGNWPGVTVEKKEGRLKGHRDVTIVDLPGIYSLSPYTMEEVVARNYLIGERPDAVINIVDGTNLERNLYLSTQIMELGIPVVMAVNMMDAVEKAGDRIHMDRLGERLGCEVIGISALKGHGVWKAAQKAVDAAMQKKSVEIAHRFGVKAENAIASVEDKLGSDIPRELRRFFAVKLLERDEKIAQSMEQVPDVSEEIRTLEKEFDDDAESIITNERYVYLSSVIGECATKNKKKITTVSDRIDRWVTDRWLALPFFAAVMWLVYYVSVSTVGGFATDWTNDVLFGEIIPPAIESVLTAAGCAHWLQGLILDGIVAGVGAVLGFVPQMLVLFLFLAFLESCGYMARVAFIMDRIFRRFGLSGKSFIPAGNEPSGHACMHIWRLPQGSIPRSSAAGLLTPCGAKLPVIGLIAGAVFGGASWVAPSAYFVGIAAVICSGIVLKKTKLFSGDPAPFVMELPPYHMPTPGAVLRSMWERGWSFIRKAGTIILLSTVILWFFMSFGFTEDGFGMLEAQQLDSSILAGIGSLISWVFAPLGWGDWKMAVAALTGLIAKENVVGTLGILFGFAEVAENGEEIWGQLAGSMSAVAAYSFLVFNLLCAPCFAAMGAIKREMNSAGWFWFAIGYQCGLAYLASLCVYQIGMLVGEGAFGAWTIAAFLIIIGFAYLLFRSGRKEGFLTEAGEKLAKTK